MVCIAAGRGPGKALKKFNALIDELRALPPAERAAAEQRLREAYEVERAVLALDMSGFSASVRRSGIIAHLCQIRRVQQVAIPLIDAAGGQVVKCEADNILAVFANTQRAVDAAIAINRALAAQRDAAPGEAPLAVSIGIDFGRFLLIPAQDAFGDTVNVAYKLGEDIARPEEILLTEEAWRRLGEAQARTAQPQDLSISGIELRAWRIMAGSQGPSEG